MDSNLRQNLNGWRRCQSDPFAFPDAKTSEELVQMFFQQLWLSASPETIPLFQMGNHHEGKENCVMRWLLHVVYRFAGFDLLSNW
jgi:hypothetical protein